MTHVLAKASLVAVMGRAKRPWLTAAFLTSALCTPGPAVAARYSPLDCAKASSPAELTICRTYSLGQAEARMATLFAVATSLVPMGQRGEIDDEQVHWLKTREACGSDLVCLTAAYDSRIKDLNKVIEEIGSRGPF